MGDLNERTMCFSDEATNVVTYDRLLQIITFLELVPFLNINTDNYKSIFYHSLLSE